MILILMSIIACLVSVVGLYCVRNRSFVYAMWTLGLGSITAAVMQLLSALVEGEFTLRYVYEHSSVGLPLAYRISALWAGQEGSFMIWALILVLMGYFVLGLAYERGAKVMVVYSAITISLLVMTYISKPFELLPLSAKDGLGLNQALQDPWMVVHPPLVFIGYTAMGILMALGFGEVMNQRELKWWMRMSMVFLGLGIMTGSVWAYRALGWGGYWAWDPIENIALVPWLLLCAYSHGKEKITRVQCALPFGIAAFGTFLARSGLLQERSAHAYASGNNNWALLVLWVFIGLTVLVGSYTLWHMRKSSWFRFITFIYAIAILVATILPLVCHYEVPISFFNNLTLIYVALNAILLIEVEWKRFKEYRIWIVSLATILCMGIMIWLGSYEWKFVGVLWLVLVPTIGYISTLRGRIRSGYYWIHLLLLLMFIGGITSSGMGGHYMKNMKEESLESLVKTGKSIIQYGVLADEIIEEVLPCSTIGEVTVTYTQKPLMVLFWAGSFGLIGIMLLKRDIA